MNKEKENTAFQLSREEAQAIMEALLFVSSEPVQEEDMLSVLGPENKDVMISALHQLIKEYTQPCKGVNIEKVAGGYRLATKRHLSQWIGKYRYIKNRTRLSQASMETLAIIAYKQPITLPEIQLIRGVNPAGAIKTLLEKRMIRITGRKKAIGKPFLYGTTKFFLIHFGLDSLEDLPSMDQFDRMMESSMDMGTSPSMSRD